LDSLAHQPFGAKGTHGFDANGRIRAHIFAQLVIHEGDNGLGFV
jgi:hypothetical protein